MPGIDQPKYPVYIHNEALKLGDPSKELGIVRIPGLANLVTQTNAGDLGFSKDPVNLAAVMIVINATDVWHGDSSGHLTALSARSHRFGI